MKRVAVVADNTDAIADEVRRQVQQFDVVITSGGVGPTHDDITIFAVAGALNQCIRPNEVRYSSRLELGKQSVGFRSVIARACGGLA